VSTLLEHLCKLPEDGDCVEICSSKLIVKYRIYGMVHLLLLIVFVIRFVVHGMNGMKLLLRLNKRWELGDRACCRRSYSVAYCRFYSTLCACRELGSFTLQFGILALMYIDIKADKRLLYNILSAAVSNTRLCLLSTTQQSHLCLRILVLLCVVKTYRFLHL
jgi:hypothetical protein